MYRSERAKRARSASVVTIVALVLLSGMITSAYIVAVHYSAIQGRRQNAVEQAATAAAEDLLQVTIESPRFGQIGLTDHAGQRRVLGINTLFASLRLDALVAEKLSLRDIVPLIEQDLEIAHAAKDSLRDKLLLTASPQNNQSIALPAQPSNSGAVWSKVQSILSNSTSSTSEKLKSFTLKLGHLNRPTPCTTPLPDFEQVTGREPNYSSNAEISMPQSKPIRFVEMRTKTTLVPPELFSSESSELPPSVVLVSATFNVPAQGKNPAKTVVREACAVLGAQPLLPLSSTFLVSFPFGAPPQFGNLRSMLSFDNWTGTGSWLQAVGGAVPGKGHLTRLENSSTFTNSPMQAVHLAFYHWLLQCGPAVRLDRVKELLDSPWPINTFEGDAVNHQNSALTHETGARTYAVLNQSDPGGAGQQLLAEAFAARVSSRSFPSSALPLFIDQHGNCNLPGRQGVDKEFLLAFINDLYETNLASVESHNIARTILNRMNLACEQQIGNAGLEREELYSIDQRLARLKAAQAHLATGTADSRELSQQETLRRAKLEKIERVKARLKEYEAVRARARLALRNADTAWLATWDIGSKLNFYTRGGLHRVVAPHQGYLLNGKQVFVPHRQPLREDDVYAQDVVLKSQPVEPASAWLSNNFQVLSAADDKAVVEGLPLPDARQRFKSPLPAAPNFFAWTSSQLTSTSQLQTRALRQSPFDNSGIDPSQLAFHAANAISSGKSPEVTWSVLIRDEVAFKGGGGGEPVRGHQGWCSEQSLTFEECPGLACEIQVRAPLPLLQDLPAAPSVAGLTNQDRVSLIPPTPLSML